jgi:nitric oxide synthase oxygenase domain/subunit
MAIKKGHIMLMLLMLDKYKVANMDVYLAPLVEEFQVLWQGVQMEDMSKALPERQFYLRAILELQHGGQLATRNFCRNCVA